MSQRGSIDRGDVAPSCRPSKTAHINHALVKGLHPHFGGIYTMAILEENKNISFQNESDGALESMTSGGGDIEHTQTF